MSKKSILLIITLVITALIFSQSIMTADASSEESGTLLILIGKIASALHLPMLMNDFIIRKLAHFTEFAVYGFFLTWTTHEWSGSVKNNIFKILFFIILVPLCDETIQLFSVGRSGEVRDVLLDIGGALTGFAAWCGIYSVVKTKRKAAKNSHSEK